MSNWPSSWVGSWLSVFKVMVCVATWIWTYYTTTYTFSGSFSDILRWNSENAVWVQKFSSEVQIKQVYFRLSHVHFKIGENEFQARELKVQKIKWIWDVYTNNSDYVTQLQTIYCGFRTLSFWIQQYHSITTIIQRKCLICFTATKCNDIGKDKHYTKTHNSMFPHDVFQVKRTLEKTMRMLAWIHDILYGDLIITTTRRCSVQKSNNNKGGYKLTILQSNSVRSSACDT